MNYVAVVMRAAELEKPNSDIASHTGTHCMHAHFLGSLNCVLYYIIIGKGWKTPTTFFDHLGGIRGILPLLNTAGGIRAVYRKCLETGKILYVQKRHSRGVMYTLLDV